MTALNNMRKRLEYNGGTFQQNRMIQHKYKSLQKALLYSYQSGNMIIDNADSENNTFRCLMNPDKRTFDADKMMLSVPYTVKNANGEEVTVPVSCGKTFVWENTNTRWIITLQYIEELAYFRADVRKCFPYSIEINDNQYYFASIGEREQILDWNRKNGNIWNKLNYTREIYIERNADTIDYFKRFKIIKLPNIENNLESWEVQAVAPNAVDNILIVYLKEYFENEHQELSDSIQQQKEEEQEENSNLICKVYDSIQYTVPFVENAKWYIDNITNNISIKILDAVVEDNNTTVYIQLMNGKTGEFDILYNDVIVKHVFVKAL